MIGQDNEFLSQIQSTYNCTKNHSFFCSKYLETEKVAWFLLGVIQDKLRALLLMILYFAEFWPRWKSCKILIKILQDLVRKKLHHFNWTHIPPPSLSSKWNISQPKRTKKSKESSMRISHLHTNIACVSFAKGQNHPWQWKPKIVAVWIA